MLDLTNEDVRKSIVAANQNRPKGTLESEDKHWQIGANDQISKAKDYLPLIISYKNNLPLRLSDVATASDSMQDIHNAGNANGKPAIILLVFKQPNANIIETVEQINALMPELKASISTAIDIKTVMERTTTIKAALHDVEITLLISLILVVLVVFAFLRNWSSTFIPAVAILVSLIGTFAAMYLLNYSLNNLSLMAITIATGFVVDDAIVVLENITRHLEKGIKPMRAAMIGAKEVGFTVISMSISLIAVFIPLLFMGGIIGRIFNEFINTLSISILISLLVSLTLTPMMCSILQKNTSKHNPNGKLLDLYAKTLSWALKHKFTVLISLIATIIFNIYLYTIMPYGLLPKQDTGRLTGSLQADQNISFKALNEKLDRFVEVIRLDPAIDNIVGIIGGGQQVNTGRIFVSLKPLAERKISAEEIIARLRKNLEKEPGAKLVMQSSQDISAGGRQSAAQY
ncbi:MAG: efflux RND transporter permease subunit, partial [Pseudomonadota bacterium]